MPDISILRPTVLLGVVEKFKAPEKMTMLSMVPQRSHPFPTAQWEVVQGARAIARPNVPNSEANIVPQRGRASQSSSFMYIREKKVFEPSTLLWMRKLAENVSDLSVLQNVEQKVTEELEDLNRRADNLAEWSLWQALTGELVYTSAENGVIVDVDYMFPASHKATAGTSWGSATAQQIIEDVYAWKTLIRRNGQVEPRDAFATESTIRRIFKAFTTSGASPELLTDRMREEYFRSATISGFMGLNWRVQESTYDSTDASYSSTALRYPSQDTPFLAEDAIVLGNFTENRPIQLMVGPTADHDAPRNYTGKYVKTWVEPDPSARQALLEWNIMPIITRPEQFVYVADVTA